MNLLEIFDKETYNNRTTEKDDNSVKNLSDIRKTKLTLAQLNRLRIMNDVRKLENEEKLEKVKIQYKTPVEAPQV
jgi:hypothetical protein